MKKNGKVVCIVLDGVGIGAAPDAHLYHDESANTFCNTAIKTGGLHMPNMALLGLGNIAEIMGIPKQSSANGNFGKMREVSKGKDSTTGHWEFSGIILEKDFPYYPNGFPADVIEMFCSLTGCKKVLGNKAASGTVILEELGAEHERTGFPIIYTSADSVFQIAANEQVIPLERLYELCTIARHQVMVGPHAVGRVIARPFAGSNGKYQRTTNRRDFSLLPPALTMLDILFKHHIPTVAIGKIDDLFAGKSLSEKIHTKSNAEGIEETIAWANKTPNGFVFTNLVDFDALFGHRQDADGMKGALEYFDMQLPRILTAMHGDDLLVITADHGNDPTDNSTDHSREYVPLVVYSPNGKKNVDLGIRQTFADLGKTVVHYFGFEHNELKGTSFLSQVL
ncbi:MAG: phosphopentomutase [Bacteriovoracaceae bacterium]|nr:phosphopentomutase [Bacteroidota bacterium]